MRTHVLLSLLLLVLLPLAGCIGGDDPAPALGTYEQVASNGAGGDHSGHGASVGLQHTAQAWRFNATYLEPFDHEGEELGLQLTIELTTGSLLVEVLDPSGQALLTTTATGQTTVEEQLAGAPGTWHLRVNGTDATGTVQATAGEPAQLGMVQDPPIRFEQTLTFTTQAWDHTWATPGNATLVVDGVLAFGSVSITILDGMAQPIDPVVLDQPGEQTGTWQLGGAPGIWTVAITAEDATGQLALELSGT